MEPDICSVIVRQYFDQPPSQRQPATVAIEVSLAQAFDDGNHQRQVVNHRTATMNADGSVRVVLAHDDPRDPNWLDTGGFTEGSLIFRFLYPEAKPDRPHTEVLR